MADAEIAYKAAIKYLDKVKFFILNLYYMADLMIVFYIALTSIIYIFIQLLIFIHTIKGRGQDNANIFIFSYYY